MCSFAHRYAMSAADDTVPRSSLWPRVRLWVGPLPPWMVSGVAAYRPWNRTIHLRIDQPLQYVFFQFLHELGHHAVECAGGNHRVYDRIWTNRVGKCILGTAGRGV